jgi:hypothetical protein
MKYGNTIEIYVQELSKFLGIYYPEYTLVLTTALKSSFKSDKTEKVPIVYITKGKFRAGPYNEDLLEIDLKSVDTEDKILQLVENFIKRNK